MHELLPCSHQQVCCHSHGEYSHASVNSPVLVGRRSHPPTGESAEAMSLVQQFDLPTLPQPKASVTYPGGWEKVGISGWIPLKLSSSRRPGGTLHSAETRNDLWTLANIKKQQHGALRFYPLGIHLSPRVDTEQCYHVTLYVAVAVNTSSGQRELLRAFIF